MSSDQPVQIPPTPEGSPTPLPGPNVGESGVTAPSGRFGVADGVGWFSVIALLALAFLVTAFSDRTSGVWRHLATGRLIAQGEYSFGQDPFSFVGDGRTWVNHSWLYDIGLYQLYQLGGGALIVAAKATLVCAIFAVLLSFRRKGEPLWPWAVIGAVGLLALAPVTDVRPSLLTMLFLAGTLRLLCRPAPDAPAWRLPALVAVMFVLWANCDEWFFLGPLLLLLWLLGGLLSVYLLEVGEEDDAQKPGRVPLNWVAIALAVGFIATLVNPHVHRVWTLPPELISTEFRTAVEQDPSYMALTQWTINASSPFDGGYSDNPVNVVAFLLLIVMGFTALAVNYRRVNGESIAVWFGFAVLGFLHSRAVGAFVVTAVPLTAMNFLQAGRPWLAKFEEPNPDRRWPVFLAAVGRSALCLGMLGLLFCSWPGWLNRDAADPNAARRVSFSLREDDSFVRTAETLNQLREEGRLPEDFHGLLNVGPLAHYIEWYAPEEKTFFDLRYGFHAEELDDFLELRRVLREYARVEDNNPATDPAARDDLRQLMEKYSARYLVFSESNEAFYRVIAARLLSDPEWACWYYDGRTAIFGWTPPGTGAADPTESLRVSPLRTAFGPDVEPLAEPDRILAPAPRGFFERYATAPPEEPWQSTKVLADMLMFQLEVGRLRTARQQSYQQLFLERLALGAVAGPSCSPSVLPIPAPAGDPADVLASLTIAARDARRAIIASPDHFLPYRRLSQVYQDQAAEFLMRYQLEPPIQELLRRPRRSLSDVHQARVIAGMVGGDNTDIIGLLDVVDTQFGRPALTALTRAHARLPAAPEDIPERHRGEALLILRELASMHLHYGHLDIALEYWKEARRLLIKAPPPGIPEEERDEVIRQIDDLKWQLPPNVGIFLTNSLGRTPESLNWGELAPEDLVNRVSDIHANTDDPRRSLGERFRLAFELGLPREALDMFDTPIAEGRLQSVLAEGFNTPEQQAFGFAMYLGFKLLVGEAEAVWQEVLTEEGREEIDKRTGNVKRQFRDLQYRTAFQCGLYEEALGFSGELLGLYEGVKPNPAEQFARFDKLPFVAGAVTMPVVRRQLSGIDQFVRSYSRDQLLRGLIAVEAGHLEVALTSFRKAVRPFGLGIQVPVLQLAGDYGAAIEKARQE